MTTSVQSRETLKVLALTGDASLSVAMSLMAGEWEVLTVQEVEAAIGGPDTYAAAVVDLGTTAQGLEAARALRELRPVLQCVVLGDTRPEGGSQFPVLLRPFSMDELSAAIKGAVSRLPLQSPSAGRDVPTNVKPFARPRNGSQKISAAERRWHRKTSQPEGPNPPADREPASGPESIEGEQKIPSISDPRGRIKTWRRDKRRPDTSEQQDPELEQQNHSASNGHAQTTFPEEHSGEPEPDWTPTAETPPAADPVGLEEPPSHAELFEFLDTEPEEISLEPIQTEPEPADDPRVSRLVKLLVDATKGLGATIELVSEYPLLADATAAASALVAEIAERLSPEIVVIYAPDEEDFFRPLAAHGLSHHELQMKADKDHPLIREVLSDLEPVRVESAGKIHGFLAGLGGARTDELVAAPLHLNGTAVAVALVGKECFTERELEGIVDLVSQATPGLGVALLIKKLGSTSSDTSSDGEREEDFLPA